MKLLRSVSLAALILVLLPLWLSASPAIAFGDPPSSPETPDHPLAGDGLHPPPPSPALTSSAAGSTPNQPSGFLAGHVAVQLVFVESDGGVEPSSEDWTADQIATIRSKVGEALEWWRKQLPNARLRFDLSDRVVGSQYEPIQHRLSDEGRWIGDVLRRLGYSGTSYFDQAYAAAAALRADSADWATTIFIVNSAADADGRFADGLFAYAYIGGPFMVITSDAGPYGTSQLAPVVAHEFGHIFGALDQYAAAGTPCTQRSGYLDVPTTNSQANNCGTHFSSIMLDPLPAFASGAIDDSALGQIGYRDQDHDSIPDPLDTTPALQVTLTQPPAGGRPTLAGQGFDQPWPSPSKPPATLNTITAIEYRIDGGPWIALPPADGAYDSALEEVNAILPLYDGQHTVELRALNSIGAASPSVSQAVTVSGIGAAPAYDVTLPALSNTTAITLGLVAPADAWVQISEDPFFAEASWVAAQPSVGWQLSPTDGSHTIYVRFRDRDGLESPPLARSVLLDREPPTGQAIVHAGDRPQLELQARDGISGVVGVLVGHDDAAGDWQPFQPVLALPPGTTSVWVRFRDAAGNVSDRLPARDGYLTYLPLVVR